MGENSCLKWVCVAVLGAASATASEPIVWSSGEAGGNSNVDVSPDREAERAQEELEDWNWLVRAIETLETGTPEQRFAQIEEIDEEMLLDVLDDPPDDDRRLTEDLARRLRTYVASESDSWLVYVIARQLWDVDAIEILPLVDDLMNSRVPSVRAAAIDAMYNYLDPEEWISEKKVVRRIEELWAFETYPPARVHLLEAMDMYDVPLPLPTLRHCIDGEDEAIAIAAIDYLTGQHPEGWVELALRGFSDRRQARSLKIIRALGSARPPELSKGQLSEIRSFLETRVNSRRYAWARAPMLEVLARLGSDVAEDAVRDMLRSERVLTAIEGIDLLVEIRPDDLPLLLSQRALEGDDAIRARALVEIGGLSWDPFYEDAVRRASMEDQLSDAVLAALWSARIPSSDRAHMLPVWEGIQSRRKSGGPRVTTSVVFEPSEPPVPPGETPPLWVVVAPPGQETVRCHAAPGHEARPANAERAHTGQVVSGERFDDIDRSWYEVALDCWVDASHVALRDHPLLRPVDRPHEVDIAETMLSAPIVVELRRMKALEVFDVGQRLAGCRITVDIEDAETLAILRDAERLSRTNLVESVREMLPRIREIYGSLEGWDAWIQP